MDVDKIRKQYRRVAGLVDGLIRGPTNRLRHEAIQRLELRPGDRVLDLGCGTGLSLPSSRKAVGSTGIVYGVELSREMLAQARRKGTCQLTLGSRSKPPDSHRAQVHVRPTLAREEEGHREAGLQSVCNCVIPRPLRHPCGRPKCPEY